MTFNLIENLAGNNEVTYKQNGKTKTSSGPSDVSHFGFQGFAMESFRVVEPASKGRAAVEEIVMSKNGRRYRLIGNEIVGFKLGILNKKV